ncbi:MAG: hypothetical protein AAB479_02100 [Patescibacteria group bacterium]
MLKSISGPLRRREASYQQNQSRLTIVAEIIKIFFQQNLNIDFMASGTRCEWAQNILEIHTGNKALASELTIRLGEFTKFLGERGVEPLQIIIR